jgi:hypothetical protein
MNVVNFKLSPTRYAADVSTFYSVPAKILSDYLFGIEQSSTPISTALLLGWQQTKLNKETKDLVNFLPSCLTTEDK